MPELGSKGSRRTSRRWRRGHDSFDLCAGSNLVELGHGARRGAVLLYVPLGLSQFSLHSSHCWARGCLRWCVRGRSGSSAVAAARDRRNGASMTTMGFHDLQMPSQAKGHYTEVRVPLLRIAKNDTRIVSVRDGQPGRVRS